MRKTAIWAAAAVASSAGVLAGSAAATPPSGDVARTQLGKGTTNTPISIVTGEQETAFYVQQLQVMPGATSGWHSHPGFEYSIVTKGTVAVQMADTCEMVTYRAGDVVFIPPGAAHFVANHGPEEVESLSTFTVPAELPPLTDEPAACT